MLYVNLVGSGVLVFEFPFSVGPGSACQARIHGLGLAPTIPFPQTDDRRRHGSV